MRTAKSLLFTVAVTGLTLATQTSFATESNHQVTRSQLNRIPEGCSSAEVKRELGAPESVTRWLDGSRSLVYEITTHFNEQQHVYIDLDSNDKMTDIQIIER